MSTELGPYPAYRDSGVEWLGRVPEHWDTRRLRTVLAGVTKRNRSDLPLLSVVREKGVILRDVSDSSGNHNYIPDDLSNYKLVRRGWFAINKMKAWQGSFGVSAEDGIVSPAYHIYKVSEVETDFFHVAIRSRAYVPYFSAASDGVRIGQWDLSATRMRAIPFVVPTKPEQSRIARFLEAADRRIRRYIRAKERLVELLEERKRALIHEAVTGRIDVRTGQPYPAYKDSGVEWLGKVPEHWEVRRLGQLIDLTVGFPFKSDGFTQARSDIRLLRGVNIAPGTLRWDDVVHWPIRDWDSFEDYEMEVGDIVLGMDRPIIQAGIRVAVVSASDVPSLLLQRVARIRVKDALRRDYAVELIGGKGFSDYLAPIFTGISVPHLSAEQIRTFRFALPNATEQLAIMHHVESRTRAIRSATARILQQVHLLREYRTRLIADVVTGKLDVRDAAADLPETDPLAGDRDRTDTIPTESSLHSTAHDMAKEAIP